MLIGLAGTYCAGKNRVASILERRGIPVLDVDRLAHACLERRRDDVFARFGDGARNADGTVNRRALGAMVFGDGAALADLEAIVHPETNRMTVEWAAERKGAPCAVNAALIHKSALFHEFDLIILVTAPAIARLARGRRRDGLSWLALLRRFASQRRFESQYFAGSADIFRVANPGIGRPAQACASSRGATKSERRLEKRIDEILSRFGPRESPRRSQ